MAQPLPEYTAKTVFLYGLIKFSEWPSEAGTTTIDICLFGADPISESLSAIEGKPALGRTVHIRRENTLDQVKTCHILFVSETERNKLPGALRPLERLPILTVSDMEDFLSLGGMIGLTMDENRIQFDVNLKAIEKTQIKLSSQLLNLARNLRKDGL